MGDQDVYRGEMRQDTPLNSALCKIWYRLWQISGFSTSGSGGSGGIAFTYPTGNPNTFSLTAGQSHTIPAGAFNIGILPTAGTVTVDGVSWPASTPYNFEARVAADLVVTCGSPGTAIINYLL